MYEFLWNWTLLPYKILQVEERGAEFFSNLVFKDVSSRHSGLYTCVASNSAAKVNFTAELIVKGTLSHRHQPSTAFWTQYLKKKFEMS